MEVSNIYGIRKMSIIYRTFHPVLMIKQGMWQGGFPGQGYIHTPWTWTGVPVRPLTAFLGGETLTRSPGDSSNPVS